MTRPELPSVNRKRLAWQASGFCVMLLVLGMFWLRDRPERLMNLVVTEFKISGDRAFIPARRNVIGKGPLIQTLSIHDGALRTLVEEDAHSQFSRPNTFSIENGQLYYAVQPRPERGGNRAANSTSASASAAVGLTSLGAFLPPRQNPSPAESFGQRRFVLPGRPLPTKDTHIRQVSVLGGTPVECAALRGEQFCLVGSHLFWVRPRRGQTTQVVQGRNVWTEVTAHSDLMLTSLRDGVTRCIRSDSPRPLAFAVGEAGVTWAEPAPFPEKPMLFYADASDGSVHVLGTTSDDQTIAPVVEFGGRLYWAVNHDDLAVDANSPSGHSVLMSANRDGSEQRVVFERVGKHLAADLTLHTYQGNLYGRFTELPAVASDPFKSKLCLGRLHPDRSDPIEIVHHLPLGAASYQFDGAYLYFVVREAKRNLWSALTEDNAGTGETYTLCRLPIAE